MTKSIYDDAEFARIVADVDRAMLDLPADLRDDVRMLGDAEFRAFPAGLRMADRSNGAAPQIKGRAATYNTLSNLLGPPGKQFRERILPGFFARALAPGADVRALFNHNPDAVLGRTVAGTMKLRNLPDGLDFEIYPPDTQAGRDAVTSIERGDVTGVSFGFRNPVDRWKTENGERVRELISADVFDISPTAFPAYDGTSVAVRGYFQDGMARARRLRLARADGDGDGVESPETEHIRRRLRLAELD